MSCGPAISPAVHGTKSFLRRVFWLHMLGHLLGGAALGVVLGMAAALVRSAGADTLHVVTLVITGTITVYAVAEILPWSIWRPNSHWQVPESFRRTQYVGSMALLWGTLLGAGLFTMNITAAFVIMCLSAVAAPVDAAILVGVSFGVVRGLTVLLGWGAKDFDEVLARFTWPARHTTLPRVVTCVAGMSLAIVLVVG